MRSERGGRLSSVHVKSMLPDEGGSAAGGRARGPGEPRPGGSQLGGGQADAGCRALFSR